MKFDIITRANSTGYKLGDLITPVAINGHIYTCTTPGVSDSSPPAFATGTGATTTDGAVTWTECNPAGVTYTGPLTFQTQPKYGDMVHHRKYAQPVDYSVGGDVYSYDKGTGVRESREITFQRMLSADLDKLLDFIDLIRGARHNFLFTDENALVHTVKLINADDITSTPTDYGYESDIMMELYLMT